MARLETPPNVTVPRLPAAHVFASPVTPPARTVWTRAVQPRKFPAVTVPVREYPPVGTAATVPVLSTIVLFPAVLSFPFFGLIPCHFTVRATPPSFGLLTTAQLVPAASVPLTL